MTRLRSINFCQPTFALILGAISFFLVVGPQSLSFDNISWLQDGDPATHYLGWAFFRDDAWQFPIGLNPNFGLGISTSIVFSDSIPIMAFILKPFSVYLPTVFQYLGLWVLLSFILQAFFAWELSGLMTKQIWARYAVVIILIFSPPMLARFGETTALSAHFLILAALYLNLRESTNRDGWWWGLLLVISVLVHFYLFAPILILWTAACGDRIRNGFVALRLIFLEFLGVMACIAMAMWQAGYFSVSIQGASVGKYGEDALNLNALVNSAGWSYILPSTQYFYHAEGGFNYLGLGALIAFIVTLMLLIKSWKRLTQPIHHHSFLIAALIGIAIFSISNTIHIGSHVIHIPLPEGLMQLATILRSSGRIFWPVYYSAVIVCCYAILMKWPNKYGYSILIFLALIQVVDTSAGWRESRRVLQEKTTRPLRINQFTDEFWSKAGLRYDKYVRARPQNIAINWESIAFLAQRSHGSTNSAYFARLNESQLEASRREIDQKIKSLKLDQDTLYFLENKEVVKHLKYVGPQDFLSQIDGLNVLAPNWKNCDECQAKSKAHSIIDDMQAFQAGIPVDIGKSYGQFAGYFLNSGWALPESWGVWSEGTQSELMLPYYLNRGGKLLITARALVNQFHLEQSIDIFVNGSFSKRVVLRQWNNEYEVDIPPADSDVLRVEFRYLNPVRPITIQFGVDDRLLAIGLMKLQFKPRL